MSTAGPRPAHVRSIETSFPEAGGVRFCPRIKLFNVLQRCQGVKYVAGSAKLFRIWHRGPHGSDDSSPLLS